MKKLPESKLRFSVYTIRLNADMRQSLEDFAERNEMQVSQAIRLAVKRMIEDKDFQVE